jgi:hypothetical protein
MKYKIIAHSNWHSPEVYRDLSKEQAQEKAWELKNEQYQVKIEEEDDEILGLTPNYDY